MITELFHNIFEADLVKELNDKGRVVEEKEGTILLDIGQTVRSIPMLLQGSIKIIREDEQGTELLLYYLSALESCAMTFTCCMQQYPSEVRAIAEKDSVILWLPISVMDEWLQRFPTWKSYVMKNIRARFNELLTAIDQLAFLDLDERLVHYLKERSAAMGSSLINLSHEQIANDLATSRVVISRLLKKLELDKKVLLYRNQIKLLKEL
jgi:CRP/FNR family transcriptional regulator, anaerobic regulatory protein